MSPLYSFKCKKCGHPIEILCSVPGEYLVREAPVCKCGAQDWTRIPTAAAIRFEGEGWDTQKAKGGR